MSATLLDRVRATVAEPESPTEDASPLIPEITSLRQSMISTYLRCPRQFEYRYLLRRPERLGARLPLGTGVHKATEVTLQAKIDGKEPDAEEAAQVAVEATRRGIKDAPDGVEYDDEVTDESEAVDRAALFGRTFATDVAPKIKPAAVEVAFETEIAGVPVSGRIDCIEVDGHVQDTKTSAKAPNKADVLGSPQPEIYLATREHNVGMRFDYLVFRKPTQRRAHAGVEHVPISITGEDAELVAHLAEDTVRDVAHGIKSGTFPRNRMGWHCSRRHCAFFDECMGGGE